MPATRPVALAERDLEVLKEAVAMGLLSQAFKSKHVVLTGTLSLRRDDVAVLIKATGGHVDGAIGSMTHFLVMGDTGRAGYTIKQREAESRGVKVLTESEFVELMLNGDQS